MNKELKLHVDRNRINISPITTSKQPAMAFNFSGKRLTFRLTEDGRINAEYNPADLTESAQAVVNEIVRMLDVEVIPKRRGISEKDLTHQPGNVIHEIQEAQWQAFAAEQHEKTRQQFGDVVAELMWPRHRHTDGADG